MAATLGVGLGVVDTEDAVDAMKMVDPDKAMKVSAPIAKLTAIRQMHAESANTHRREETTEMISAFASSVGSQATPNSIASPTNV